MRKKLAPQMAPTKDESYYADGGDVASGYDPVTGAIQQKLSNAETQIKQAALQKMINSGLVADPNAIQMPVKQQQSVPVQSPDYVPSSDLSAQDKQNREGALASNPAMMQAVSDKLKANAASQTTQDNQMNALEDEKPEDEEGYTTYKRMPKTRKMMGNDEDED